MARVAQSQITLFKSPLIRSRKTFLAYLSVFPFFSRDFRGSVGIENPCFWGGFPCLFPKKNKERKDRVENKGESDLFKSPLIQGQESAQGILRPRNPNLGPNSVKRILDARILDPNSWVEFFDSVFSSKRGPLKNSRSRNSPPKIHLPKFNPEIGPKNSHCTSAATRAQK